MVIKLNSTDVDIENFDSKLSQSYLKALGCSNQSRFTTQDPADMQEGPNMYAYVGNIIGTTVPMSVGNPSDFLLNPVNKRDPSGLVAPNDYIDGGGAGDPYIPCPDGPWESIDVCMDFHTGPNAIEECHDLCGTGYDDGGSSGLTPPSNANCYVDEISIGGSPMGYQYGCNLAATEWISDVATIIGAASTLEALLVGSTAPVAVTADWLAAHAVICKNLGKGLNYKNMFGQAPVPWCE